DRARRHHRRLAGRGRRARDLELRVGTAAGDPRPVGHHRAHGVLRRRPDLSQPLDDPPHRRRPLPRVHRMVDRRGVVSAWTVGSATITTIVESEIPGIPPEFFFPTGSAAEVAAHDWLVPDYAAPDGTINLR